MKLFIPIEFKTGESDPNLTGETLREITFDQNLRKGTRGCYSTFDVREGCEKLNDEVVYLPSDPLENEDFYWTRYRFWLGAYAVVMRWYWDGDGTLEFIFPDNSVLFNDDCKCDYTWHWGDRKDRF